jgi:D-methionine transport system ATP-binding protein
MGICPAMGNAHEDPFDTHAALVFSGAAALVQDWLFRDRPSAAEVIEARNIGKVFPTHEGPVFALHEVDLSVASGEIFGIIGRSGAGKSTLLRILNLLERPTVGEVLLEGSAISHLNESQLRPVRQRIGMIFQHFNLLSSRTVYDNVRLPLRIAGGLSSSEEAERIGAALDLVGLTSLARKYPRQLSGGQRQRVGIARALANRPQLLLCDEATSALDPETTQSILALLRDINQRLKLTIVLITHGMDVIRAIADRVAVLDHGRIVETGPVVDVFLNPTHVTTRALLAESGLDAQEGPAAAASATGGQLWRLTYRGATVATPVLTATAREHALDVTIVRGSIGRIKDEPYAQLTLSIAEADEQRLQQFCASLARRGAHCERLS